MTSVSCCVSSLCPKLGPCSSDFLKPYMSIPCAAPDAVLFGHCCVLCSQGKCEKRVQDVIERFWDFIDQLSINTFGR